MKQFAYGILIQSFWIPFVQNPILCYQNKKRPDTLKSEYIMTTFALCLEKKLRAKRTACTKVRKYIYNTSQRGLLVSIFRVLHMWKTVGLSEFDKATSWWPEHFRNGKTCCAFTDSRGEYPLEVVLGRKNYKLRQGVSRQVHISEFLYSF